MSPGPRRARGHRFQRRSQQREPNAVILIVCEDEKAEPNYLRGLKQRLRLANVEIVPGDRTGGDPARMIAYARRRKREYEYTEAFCVFDCDARPHFDEHLKDCARRPRVAAVPSNPCVEVWFLLHFEYSTGHKGPQQAKDRLRGYLGDDAKDVQDLYGVLEDHQNNAMERATRLRKHHSDLQRPETDNPSTAMDQLMAVLTTLSGGRRGA